MQTASKVWSILTIKAQTKARRAIYLFLDIEILSLAIFIASELTNHSTLAYISIWSLFISFFTCIIIAMKERDKDEDNANSK